MVETLLSTEEINKAIASNEMALLYIASKGCGVCDVIFPRLTQLLESYPRLRGFKIELDQVPDISGIFHVFSIPCVLLYIQGKETVREARYIIIERLQEQLERYYNMLFST